MRIAAINCLLPLNEISNDEVLDLICHYSRKTYRGDLDELRAQVEQSLDATGIGSRFWRRNRERPIDLIRDSFETTLAESGLQSDNIDTIIYVGIDRGFIEPANACFVAKKLAMPSARAFDIVDACMGWCTALQVSQALIERGDAHNVLVVSSECPMDEGGIILPRGFTVSDPDELRWRFPAFTVGEAVSTTLLTRSSHTWRFHAVSDSSKADLCTIPLYKYQEYADATNKLDGKSQFDFSAYAFNLYTAGYPEAIGVLRRGLDAAPKPPAAIFPHSVSDHVTSRIGQRLGVEARVFSTFATTGNIATSSVPANVHFAMRSGLVAVGDYCLGWISSGGMKHAAFDIYL